jgi:hypothetical protein
MTLATGASAIMRWALRATKQVSPYARTKVKVGSKWSTKKMSFVPVHKIGEKKLRPWAEFAAGSEKTGFGWAGIGTEGRKKIVTGYTGTYKHVRKHKKLYVGGVVGATAWDFLPGKDNPKG